MKRVAFVFQNTRLFKDTLLNNIKAARPDATREEVLQAADEAQCKDIIDRLPNGLDTLVGTGGTYLSGGENQSCLLYTSDMISPMAMPIAAPPSTSSCSKSLAFPFAINK